MQFILSGSVLVGLINFGLALIGLICWVLLWQPGNVSLSWLSLPVAIMIFLLVAWPLAIICAIIGTLFRDFSQLLTIALQALWFVSPVFFSTEVFINGGIGFLVYDNPVYHLLELIRCSIPARAVPYVNQLRSHHFTDVHTLVYRGVPFIAF